MRTTWTAWRTALAGLTAVALLSGCWDDGAATTAPTGDEVVAVEAEADRVLEAALQRNRERLREQLTLEVQERVGDEELDGALLPEGVQVRTTQRTTTMAGDAATVQLRLEVRERARVRVQAQEQLRFEREGDGDWKLDEVPTWPGVRDQLQTRDQTQDRLRDQTCQEECDAVTEAVTEPDQDRVQDQIQDRLRDQTCDQDCEPDQDQVQDRQRDRDHLDG